MLSAKRKLILAKIESTYGVEETMASTDAQLISALDVSPAESETVERDLLRSYYGQAEKLQSKVSSKASFEVELASHGGGVIGKIPQIDSLIRACGFVGSQKTKAVTSLVQSSGLATAAIGSHSYKVGEKIYLTGANESAYNGTQTITSVTSTTISFSIASSTTTPATGSIKYWSSYDYTPISNDIPSISMKYFKDKILHILTGVRGDLSLDLSVGQIPKFKFSFTGKNNDSSDVEMSGADYSDFQTPQVVNTNNTPNFSIFGYAGALESLSIALNNEVKYTSLVGRELVEITDRKATGSVVFLEPLTADKNFWASAKNQESGELTIMHGTVNGNKVTITCPKVMISAPKNKETDNMMMISADISVCPNAGNDEITISFQ